MSISKQRMIDFLEIEWGTYVERFNRWSKAEGGRRVKEQGYERLQDMLAHIVAWWDACMEVVAAVREGRESPRITRDFDAFNAEAVAKYKSWDEGAFLAHFEETRRKVAAEVRSMDDALFESRRVQTWMYGVFIHHARDHVVALSRFLTMDTLQNEWAAYVEDFNKLPPERQSEFLSKQGFDNFHDLLAHVIGWWEEGVRIVSGILESPVFTWKNPETDSFNVALVEKYKTWSHADLLKHYETVRLALVDFVSDIPDDAFLNKDIEEWLAADVVGHYDGHAL